MVGRGMGEEGCRLFIAYGGVFMDNEVDSTTKFLKSRWGRKKRELMGY